MSKHVLTWIKEGDTVEISLYDDVTNTIERKKAASITEDATLKDKWK